MTTTRPASRARHFSALSWTRVERQVCTLNEALHPIPSQNHAGIIANSYGVFTQPGSVSEVAPQSALWQLLSDKQTNSSPRRSSDQRPHRQRGNLLIFDW